MNLATKALRALNLPIDTPITPIQSQLVHALLHTRWGSQARPFGQIRRILGRLDYENTIKQHVDLVQLHLIHLCCLETSDFAFSYRSLSRTNAFSNKDPITSSRAYGLAAFALQHMGDLKKSEEFAARALGRDETDVWAVLALLECYEIQGRHREGVRLLREMHDVWMVGPFRSIFASRKCAFLLEQGSLDSCLRSYDAQVLGGEEENGWWKHWEFADRAGLLLRAKLAGVTKEMELTVDTDAPRLAIAVPIGYRARTTTRAEDLVGELRNAKLMGAGKKLSGFDAVFNCVALLAAETPDASLVMKEMDLLSNKDFEGQELNKLETNDANPWIDALTPSSPAGAGMDSNDVAVVAVNVGKPIRDALSGYALQSDEAVVRALLKCRFSFAQLGGTQWQRDIFDQITLTASLKWARQSRNQFALKLARGLSYERLSHRPVCTQSWIWHAEMSELFGDEHAATHARGRATDLGMGQGGHNAN